MLVLLSFFRANPRFGEAGRKDAAHPLPGCLEQMLTKSVLKKAKQDTLGKVKKMVEKSMDVKAVLREHAPKLKREFDRLTQNRQGGNQRGPARPGAFCSVCIPPESIAEGGPRNRDELAPLGGLRQRLRPAQRGRGRVLRRGRAADRPNSSQVTERNSPVQPKSFAIC